MGVFEPAPGIARIDLAAQAEFDLGAMRVKPAERAVVVNGKRSELQPRVMQVLVALARARPGVVSREILMEQCWKGCVVGDDALNRCVLALRHLAENLAPPPFAIETVARVGYRLIEHGAKSDAASPTDRSKRWRLAPLITAIVLALAAALYAWQQRGSGEQPASIAVLPFRNLSSGEPHFAQGISEEISGQLTREPQFQVAGRASSNQFGDDPDPREVARKLKVDYVLEGSVRTQGDRVRVNADLVRASDSVRLWSNSYDGTLDDIFAIQGRIGAAIAEALKRKLAGSPPGKARRVNGEAYALYLNARGLIRSGNPQSGQDAIGLLRQAMKADPGYAPAWSGLAEALHLDGRTKGAEGLIAVLPRAQAAARRALQLDPNLADAHGVMAVLLGSDSPEAVAHLRRAAELDPRSGQGQLWRGMAHYISGEYGDGLAAYRRAHELDPLWPNPVRVLVDVTSGMGDRPAAEAAVRSGFPDDAMLQQFALGRVAWLMGDFSEAARRWSLVAAEPSSRWASPAKLSLEDAKFMLKLSDASPSRPANPSLGQNRQGPRVWMAAAPSPAEWLKNNRSFAAALVNHDGNVVAAKRMLAAGRARELAATYDGPVGLLYMRRGVPMGVCDLHEAALVALALRGAGRGAEADALLRQSDALIRAAYRRGTVPTWFDEDAAAIWAVQGKPGPAVDALERALRRGGVHAGRTDLLKLEEEPALQSLRGNPRFEAFRAKYEAHYARERAETARLLKLAAA